MIKAPVEPTIKVSTYTDLKGVDFSTDKAFIDRDRSPDMVNMISDRGGIPVKRKGYETIATTNEPIKDLLGFNENGKEYIIASTPTRLIEVDINGFGEEIAANSDNKTGVYVATLNKKGMFIFAGDKYIRAYTENNSLKFEEVEPYRPTVIISRTPTGGGVSYENINLLTRYRKEQFLNTTGNKTFLCTGQIDTTKSYSLYYRDSSGAWVKDSGATVSGATFTASSAYEPIVTGQDNIYVEYSAIGEDDSHLIKNCTVSDFFTKSTQDNIFVSGNDEMAQHVWYSAASDPTYFPDLNYLYIGGEGRIMGFSKTSEYLGVVKESGEGTVFLIYQTSLETETTVTNDVSTTTEKLIYGVKQAVTGIGAVSRRCFSTVNDEPLFFSSQGIYGITSASITSEKMTRNRSAYLDGKLTAESLLSLACATEHDNYYMLAINDKMYILDGRQKSGDYRNNTDYLYEGYYWEDIPAICLLSAEVLYFGTADGRVCRFKNDGLSTDYNDDGNPIVARWTTKADDDDNPTWYKTMNKKGTQITLEPVQKSTVNIYAIADGKERELLLTTSINVGTTFGGLVFSGLSFDNRVVMRDIVLRKKVKKYKRLQIVVENVGLDETFGIYQFAKSYKDQAIARR